MLKIKRLLIFLISEEDWTIQPSFFQNFYEKNYIAYSWAKIYNCLQRFGSDHLLCLGHRYLISFRRYGSNRLTEPRKQGMIFFIIRKFWNVTLINLSWSNLNPKLLQTFTSSRVKVSSLDFLCKIYKKEEFKKTTYKLYIIIPKHFLFQILAFWLSFSYSNWYKRWFPCV